MNLKDLIHDVLCFSVFPKLFLVGKTNFRPTQCHNFYVSPIDSGCSMKTLGNYVLIQYGEFETITVLTLDGKVQTTLDDNMNLYSSIYYKNGLLIRNRQTKSFWIIHETLHLEELHFNIRFNAYINEIFYKNNAVEISKVYPDNLWQKDISSYGRYINLREEQQPNEIDGELMSFENLLFVPLRGGQLIALDVKKGEEVWMLEQNISGQYAIIEDRIYKKNRILYEIEAHSGEILRQKEDWNGFISAGPIWAYDDMLIIVNILEGDIILFDRKTFEIKDKINIGNRMAHWKDNIIWRDNKLYVLDLNNTLHIFENEKENEF